MSDDPLMRDTINRHIKILETTEPDNPLFIRARAVVEAHRHEEVMSAHKEKLASDRKLIRLTWALLALTVGLLALTAYLAFREWERDSSTTPSGSISTSASSTPASNPPLTAAGNTPNNPAAVWSTVAAALAALCSFLIWRTQRRNYLESVRPELMLSDWTYTQDGGWTIPTFNTIRNIGRGAAFGITVSAKGCSPGPPTATDIGLIAVLSTLQIATIPADETVEVDGQIRLAWGMVQPDDRGIRSAMFCVNLGYFDTADRRHDTQYTVHSTVSMRLRQKSTGI
jgi:hypothetical protein